jgi:hypothetical protein
VLSMSGNAAELCGTLRFQSVGLKVDVPL